MIILNSSKPSVGRSFFISFWFKLKGSIKLRIFRQRAKYFTAFKMKPGFWYQTLFRKILLSITMIKRIWRSECWLGRNFIVPYCTRGWTWNGMRPAFGNGEKRIRYWWWGLDFGNLRVRWAEAFIMILNVASLETGNEQNIFIPLCSWLVSRPVRFKELEIEI